ncbi:MAG: PaaI family thioesterase [Hyphomonas sp.]
MLDSACGCVVHSTLRPGQTYTTLELKTVFHKALSAGTPVRAEGRIVQAGRRAGGDAGCGVEGEQPRPIPRT